MALDCNECSSSLEIGRVMMWLYSHYTTQNVLQIVLTVFRVGPSCLWHLRTLIQLVFHCTFLRARCVTSAAIVAIHVVFLMLASVSTIATFRMEYPRAPNSPSCERWWIAGRNGPAFPPHPSGFVHRHLVFIRGLLIPVHFRWGPYISGRGSAGARWRSKNIIGRFFASFRL